MSYPCFIERASICRERFQGTLLNPAETTGALTSPLAVPQLAGRKLIWIWLCALVCFQRRKSLTLGVSDLLLLTLLSIFFFFSFRLWLSQWIYVKLKEVPSANVTTSILYRLPQSASCERPRTRVAWRQIKSDRQTSRASEVPEDRLHQEHDVSWGYLPKSRAKHVPVQIPPTPYFLHLH